MREGIPQSGTQSIEGEEDSFLPPDKRFRSLGGWSKSP